MNSIWKDVILPMFGIIGYMLILTTMVMIVVYSKKSRRVFRKGLTWTILVIDGLTGIVGSGVTYKTPMTAVFIVIGIVFVLTWALKVHGNPEVIDWK